MENHSYAMEKNESGENKSPVTVNDLTKNKEAIAFLIVIAGIYLPWINLGFTNINGTEIGSVIQAGMDINISRIDLANLKATNVEFYIVWFVFTLLDYISFLPFILGIMIYLTFKPGRSTYLKLLKPTISFLTLFVCFSVVVLIATLDDQSRSTSATVDMRMGFHVTWIGIITSQFFYGKANYTIRQMVKRLMYFIGVIVLFFFLYSMFSQAGPGK